MRFCVRRGEGCGLAFGAAKGVVWTVSGVVGLGVGLAGRPACAARFGRKRQHLPGAAGYVWSSVSQQDLDTGAGHAYCAGSMAGRWRGVQTRWCSFARPCPVSVAPPGVAWPSRLLCLSFSALAPAIVLAWRHPCFRLLRLQRLSGLGLRLCAPGVWITGGLRLGFGFAAFASPMLVRAVCCAFTCPSVCGTQSNVTITDKTWPGRAHDGTHIANLERRKRTFWNASS